VATLIVEITHRCPCNCVECPIPENVKKHGKIMDISEFSYVLRLFADRFPDEDKYLIISGGEPSIVPNLSDYVSVAHMLGFRVTIVTNAYNPNALLRSGADLIEVSIDYANPKKHDSYRGVMGLWDRAVELARKLYPVVAVRSTWFGDNTEDIIKLADIFRDRVVCMPAVYRTGNIYRKLDMDWITKLKLKYHGVVIARECDHSRFATVDPDLNVLVCPFVRINLGKISNETLDKLAKLSGCPAKRVKAKKVKIIKSVLYNII